MLAGDHERRNVERGQRGAEVRRQKRLVGLVSELELERVQLLLPDRGPHRLACRSQPELHVHVGGGVEVARLERLVLRVRERPYLVRPGVARKRRIGEHETAHPLRMGRGKVERDAAAERRADECRSVDTDGIEHGEDVCRMAERAGLPSGAAEAAKVEARKGEPRLPRGPLRVPHPAVCDAGVDQDDVRPVAGVLEMERGIVPAVVHGHAVLLRDG